MSVDPSILVTAASTARAGTAAAFYRASRDGDFTRLAHGVWVPSAAWASTSADDRAVLRAHAAHVSLARPLVFSHQTAAAIWKLPHAATWPTRPDAIVEPERNERSRAYLSVHGEGLAGRPPQLVDGLLVTDLALTLVDVARTQQRSVAVSMLDHALRHGLVTRDELDVAWWARERSRGRTRSRWCLDFADPLAETPGESVSRVGMWNLGCPLPELQHVFVDRAGELRTDFWWPQFLVFGEFGGLGKYVKPEFMRAGESTADAVIREKKREDRIRAMPQHPVSARWDWPAAWSLPTLERTLRAAGVTW